MAGGEEDRRRVKVVDKRAAERRTATEEPEVVEGEVVEDTPSAEPDYLGDLRRLQAEFENYRKRMMRTQTEIGVRASARLVEKLLPVLDDFERAVEHAGSDSGVELIHKNLRKTLEQEGLEEIEAEGLPFDPRLHEAFSVVDDPEVDQTMVQSVHQRGYRIGDHVLRPAMVVVARPVEEPERADPASAEG